MALQVPITSQGRNWLVIDHRELLFSRFPAFPLENVHFNMLFIKVLKSVCFRHQWQCHLSLNNLPWGNKKWVKFLSKQKPTRDITGRLCWLTVECKSDHEVLCMHGQFWIDLLKCFSWGSDAACERVIVTICTFLYLHDLAPVVVLVCRRCLVHVDLDWTQFA